jgi:hypothetical protein
MIEQTEIEYFERRALNERHRAAQTDCNLAAIRHLELAEFYEDRIRELRAGRTVVPIVTLVG